MIIGGGENDGYLAGLAVFRVPYMRMDHPVLGIQLGRPAVDDHSSFSRTNPEDDS
jgi:hypothetical protein